MSGDTYLKTEVLYAGGAVQQYIATNPLAFAGADGSSPPGQGLQECPPETPPRDLTPRPPADPPPPPCIDIPGYDKCVQIYPDITGVCGETWITWNDGIVWERTYDHEPQDTYYYAPAYEYVWNITYNTQVVQSGIVPLLPGHFTPQYGNDHEELSGLWIDQITGGNPPSNIQVPLNADGSKGENWGDPVTSWIKITNETTVNLNIAKLAIQGYQAHLAQNDMYPQISHDEFIQVYIDVVLADYANVTVDKWYHCDQYYSDGMTEWQTGYIHDTLPISQTWDTDPNYPRGESDITSFAHRFVWTNLWTPGIKNGCTGDADVCCEDTYNHTPWNSWYCCRSLGSDWRMSCPDLEVPYITNPTFGVNGTQPCPPYYSGYACGCSGDWSSTNYRYPESLRYVDYTAGGNDAHQTGVSRGMSVGDYFQLNYATNPYNQVWFWDSTATATKSYAEMPCQAVARHYTNVRSLPDPASFDGVEEYTIDDLGVAHRWVWSDADRKWFEHGEKPAADGGVI